MTRAQGRSRRVKVTVEAIVDITDENALEQAVLADIETTQFSVADDSDLSVTQVRQDEQDHIRGDDVAAVQWFIDAGSVIDDRAGIEFVEATESVVEIDALGVPLSAWPRFAELFPLCTCGADDCNRCSGFQLTRCPSSSHAPHPACHQPGERLWTPRQLRRPRPDSGRGLIHETSSSMSP